MTMQDINLKVNKEIEVLKRPNRNIGNEKLKKSNKDPVESFNNR
jgi:hypothetical protein